MTRTQEIIMEMASLPVEQRALVVDSLLKSLNPPDPQVDSAWLLLARDRLAEMRQGAVQAVPGDTVFSRIKDRLA